MPQHIPDPNDKTRGGIGRKIAIVAVSAVLVILILWALFWMGGVRPGIAPSGAGADLRG